LFLLIFIALQNVRAISAAPCIKHLNNIQNYSDIVPFGRILMR